MKRIILFLLISAFVLTGTAWGVTNTQTLSSYGSFKVLEITWTSESGGTFTEWVSREVNGWIMGFETDPDGTSAPTDNYDIVLTNKNDRNIDGDTGTGASPNQDGVLANRDTANTEYTQLLFNGSYGGHPNEGALTLNINAPGNSKVGKIRIFYYSD